MDDNKWLVIFLSFIMVVSVVVYLVSWILIG